MPSRYLTNDTYSLHLDESLHDCPVKLICGRKNSVPNEVRKTT